MDAEWMLVTLEDAQTALAELIEEIESAPDQAEATLAEHLPNVYAKLNYAWHSRKLGPAAIDTLDHDLLVSFPKEMGL